MQGKGIFHYELARYPKPPSTAIRALLKRWAAHEDASATWTKIHSVCPDLMAEELIRFVVRSHGMAAGYVARRKSASSHLEYCREWNRSRVSQIFESDATLSDIADILELAAADLRYYEGLVMRGGHSLDPPTAGSRKDQHGSQARRAFCLAIFKFFREKGGKPLDAQVATLVDVAFPQADATTLEQVRAMRRPTTKAGRQRERSGH